MNTLCDVRQPNPFRDAVILARQRSSEPNPGVYSPEAIANSIESDEPAEAGLVQG